METKLDSTTSRTLRVFLIGPSAAGKTTLAAQLSARLQLPAYDLDPIAFTDTHWSIRPLWEKRRAVEGILHQPAWIVEGSHVGWTEPLLDAARVIIWLDLPLATTLRRRIIALRTKPIGFQIEQSWWLIHWYTRALRADHDTDRLPSRAAMRHFLKRHLPKVWRYRRNPRIEIVEADLRVVDRRVTGT
jgi:adenylate kinase family enzyme